MSGDAGWDAFEQSARITEAVLNTGHRVWTIDRESMRRLHRLLVLDNHDPGDEDRSER